MMNKNECKEKEKVKRDIRRDIDRTLKEYTLKRASELGVSEEQINSLDRFTDFIKDSNKELKELEEENKEQDYLRRKRTFLGMINERLKSLAMFNELTDKEKKVFFNEDYTSTDVLDRITCQGASSRLLSLARGMYGIYPNKKFARKDKDIKNTIRGLDKDVIDKLNGASNKDNKDETSKDEVYLKKGWLSPAEKSILQTQQMVRRIQAIKRNVEIGDYVRVSCKEKIDEEEQAKYIGGGKNRYDIKIIEFEVVGVYKNFVRVKDNRYRKQNATTCFNYGEVLKIRKGKKRK